MKQTRRSLVVAAALLHAMKASGFVANALRRHGIEDATVAPPRPAL
jgi:hypothetical protein